MQKLNVCTVPLSLNQKTRPNFDPLQFSPFRAGTDDQVRRILKNLSCQVSSGISKFVQTWVDFQDTLHLFGSLTIALDSENAAVYIGHIIKREQKNNESGVQSEGNREPVLRKEDAQEPIPQIGVQSKGNGEPVLRKEEDKEPIQPTGVQSEGNREPVLGKEEIKEPIQPKGVQEILFSSATADKNTEEENLGVDRTEDSQERIPLDDTHFPAELVSCVIPLLEGVSSQGERCTLEGYLTFSTAGISTSLYLKTETGGKNQRHNLNLDSYNGQFSFCPVDRIKGLFAHLNRPKK